jgi:hypothetical protein
MLKKGDFIIIGCTHNGNIIVKGNIKARLIIDLTIAGSQFGGFTSGTAIL